MYDSLKRKIYKKQKRKIYHSKTINLRLLICSETLKFGDLKYVLANE